MAMTDYPYETTFLTSKPANPVSAACEYFKNILPPSSNEDHYESLFNKLKNLVSI